MSDQVQLLSFGRVLKVSLPDNKSRWVKRYCEITDKYFEVFEDQKKKGNFINTKFVPVQS